MEEEEEMIRKDPTLQ
ncbi:hypothetical protein A2U01_0075821, partial [Trifolium medium]|nr:hypothetical protein [Trifolium medium]